MERITFTITEEHVKLLLRANVGWEDCEFGAPSIDCKRPYGNSDVYGDIAEILGFKRKEDEEFSDKKCKIMDELHKEMETVLQILLRNAKKGVKAGQKYEADRYSRNWSLVKEKKKKA